MIFTILHLLATRGELILCVRVHGIVTILFCYLKCLVLCNVHLGYKLNIFHDGCCSGWCGQLTTWSLVCSCHCLFGLLAYLNVLQGGK